MADGGVGVGRRRWRRWATALAMVGLLAIVVAGVAVGSASPPNRADELASRLRCPVCQGVSVAESRSDTALAMQDRIREMVAQGRTDAEVMDWFTERYGPWVRLDTAGSDLGFLLWVLPVLATALGLSVVAGRRRTSAPARPDPGTRDRIREQVARRRAIEEGDEA